MGTGAGDHQSWTKARCGNTVCSSDAGTQSPGGSKLTPFVTAEPKMEDRN